MSIRVPSEHMSAVPHDTVKYADVRWVTAPEPGRTLLFEVVLLPIDSGHVAIRRFELLPGDLAAIVDVGRLAGGDVVLVLAFTEPTPGGHLDAIDQFLADHAASGFGAPEAWDRTPMSAPRVLTFEDDDGVLVLHDLALGPL